MKDFNSNTDNNDIWLTPPSIIKSLGRFDLDPCFLSDEERPWDTADNHYFLPVDGLAQEWSGRVWCNPPYGKFTFDWLKKLAEHGNGIALIFARTETKGFHREIWSKADGIFFFEGRLKFHTKDGVVGGTANAPSCLVAYGVDNVAAIARSGLRGRLITGFRQV
jgi:hypothetical protein